MKKSLIILQKVWDGELIISLSWPNSGHCLRGISSVQAAAMFVLILILLEGVPYSGASVWGDNFPI